MQFASKEIAENALGKHKERIGHRWGWTERDGYISVMFFFLIFGLHGGGRGFDFIFFIVNTSICGQ